MKKEIIHKSIDTVWFDIDIFCIKDKDNFQEEFNEQMNSEYHMKNEIFGCDSLRNAVLIAETLLLREDTYNYATITLERYNGNDECEDCIVIGELWSDEIKEQSEERLFS